MGDQDRHLTAEAAVRAAAGAAARQDGALTLTAALDAGLTEGRVRSLVRSEGWSRPFRGALLAPGAHPRRGLVRAALLIRPGAVTCDATAGWLYGLAPEPGPNAPVHLLVPPGTSRTRPRGDRLRVHWGPWPAEVVEVLRFPATSPGRTVADLMLSSNREEAVGTLDVALNSRIIAETDEVEHCLAARPGGVRVRRWLALADGRAESPLETRLRLLLTDAGLAPEELQWPVLLDGRVVARLDLAWPSRRVCVEADGVAFHQSPNALLRDRRRQNDVVSMGWKLLRFTWEDVVRRPAEVVRAVADLLSR